MSHSARNKSWCVMGGVRQNLRSTRIGHVTRGEWSAVLGFVALTGGVGSAIWWHIPIDWPLSGGGWLVVSSVVAACLLVGLAFAQTRDGGRPAPRLADPPGADGWRWTSTPTSSANSPSPAQIGFRVTMVESVDRETTSPVRQNPSHPDGTERRTDDGRPGIAPIGRRANRQVALPAERSRGGSALPSYDLDDLARMLSRGVTPPARRAIGESCVEPGRDGTLARRVTGGAAAPFVCPEARRD